jgi:hypothetical protein
MQIVEWAWTRTDNAISAFTDSVYFLEFLHIPAPAQESSTGNGAMLMVWGSRADRCELEGRTRVIFGHVQLLL